MSDTLKPYAEIQAENAALRSTVDQQRTVIDALESAVAARAGEIDRLRKPKVPARKLDPAATDKFQRPFARRSR